MCFIELWLDKCEIKYVMWNWISNDYLLTKLEKIYKMIWINENNSESILFYF